MVRLNLLNLKLKIVYVSRKMGGDQQTYREMYLISMGKVNFPNENFFDSPQYDFDESF